MCTLVQAFKKNSDWLLLMLRISEITALSTEPGISALLRQSIFVLHLMSKEDRNKNRMMQQRK